MIAQAVKTILIELGEIDEESAGKLLEELIYFLVDNLQKVPSADELNRVLASSRAALPPETGEAIMTLRDLCEARSLERGIQQGVQQNMQCVIENMPLKGIPDVQICDYLGISDTELQTYKSLLLDKESC